MKKILQIISLFCFFIILEANVLAQLSDFQKQYDWVMPNASPRAEVYLRLGVTDIRVKYYRPFAKEREIWGKLVPYGKVWRAGANRATTISFSTNVSIEGQELKAGTYGLFMLPNIDEWEVIFNKRAEQWGSFTYKQTEDILRVKVKPQIAEFSESLQYTLPANSNDEAEIVLHWEKIKVPINISVNTTKQAKIKANKTFSWESAWFATNYFLTEKSDLDEALKWSNVTLALRKTYGNMLLKARVLAEMKKYEDAIKLAEEAIDFNNTSKKPTSNKYAENKIKEWKNKLR